MTFLRKLLSICLFSRMLLHAIVIYSVLFTQKQPGFAAVQSGDPPPPLYQTTGTSILLNQDWRACALITLYCAVGPDGTGRWLDSSDRSINVCRDESMSLSRLGHSVDVKVWVRILRTDWLTSFVSCNVFQNDLLIRVGDKNKIQTLRKLEGDWANLLCGSQKSSQFC